MNDPFYEEVIRPIVTAEDVRQFVYCPRIIYFRYVQRIRPPRTFKMKKGQDQHEEEVRVKDVELSDTVSKYYNYYLIDKKLGLSAILDYFESDGTEATPVDIKTGHYYGDTISDHHLAQLLAQALLLETQLHLLVRYIKVIYTQHEKIFTYEIGIDDRLRLLRHIDQIQQIIQEEDIPQPTSNHAKCKDCEFWIYCLGI